MHSFIISAFDTPDHPDTLKITPEKSVGIEEVRQIQRFLSRKPLMAPHNTVVVFQAEKLTIPAQNALLKTLEEPPAASLVYLVTSHPDTLLPTILSRCELIKPKSPAQRAPSPPPTLPPEPTRESFSQFLDDLERFLHAQIQNQTYNQPAGRHGLQPTTYNLIHNSRKYLTANCNLKLIIDNLSQLIVK